MDQFSNLDQSKDRDEKEKKYGDFVKIDYTRLYLHYSTVLEKLLSGREEIPEKVEEIWKVLDLGCGPGTLDEIMASPPYNFAVTGIDSSLPYIETAKQEAKKKNLLIDYHHVAAHEFRTDKRFDDAVSVMVLPYAPDAAYLTQFFRAACEPLESDGRFISVIFNPDFTAFDKIIGNRMFTETGDGKVQVHFLDPITKKPVWDPTKKPIFLTQFTRKEYKNAAQEGGFASMEWEELQPSEEGIEKTGEEFWEPYTQAKPYALLTARK